MTDIDNKESYWQDRIDLEAENAKLRAEVDFANERAAQPRSPAMTPPTDAEIEAWRVGFRDAVRLMPTLKGIGECIRDFTEVGEDEIADCIVGCRDALLSSGDAAIALMRRARSAPASSALLVKARLAAALCREMFTRSNEWSGERASSHYRSEIRERIDAVEKALAAEPEAQAAQSHDDAEIDRLADKWILSMRLVMRDELAALKAAPAVAVPEDVRTTCEWWLDHRKPHQDGAIDDVCKFILSLAAAPPAAPQPDSQQPRRGVVKIDRHEFSVANGVKLTANDALRLIGKDPFAHGVWCIDKRDGDYMLDGWNDLSEFHEYFTSPKIINAGDGKTVTPHPAAPQDDAELQRHLERAREVYNDHDRPDSNVTNALLLCIVELLTCKVAR